MNALIEKSISETNEPNVLCDITAYVFRSLLDQTLIT